MRWCRPVKIAMRARSVIEMSREVWGKMFAEELGWSVRKMMGLHEARTSATNLAVIPFSGNMFDKTSGREVRRVMYT